MRGEPRALRFGIVGSGEHGRFLRVGEERRRAARPGEEALRAGFAQEFGRGGIDADRAAGGARDEAHDRFARARRKEAVAGEVDHRRAFDQRVGKIARAKREIGAAVGEETALAARLDQRDQPPGLAARVADEVRRRRRRA